MTQTSGEDRRRHARRVVALKAEIAEPALGAVTAYTLDLSSGGAFILLSRDKCLPVGAAIVIRLHGAFPDETVSTLSARVVRVTDQGMGVQFFDLDFK